MSASHFSPRLLSHELLIFILLSLELLNSLVVVVYRGTEHLLCSLLTHHKVVQVLLEHLGGDFWSSDIACSTQRTGRRATRLIYTGEWLIPEVGSVELASG